MISLKLTFEQLLTLSVAVHAQKSETEIKLESEKSKAFDNEREAYIELLSSDIKELQELYKIIRKAMKY